MAIFNYYGARFDTDLLSKDKEYYVYKIIDPRSNIIIYIGKGKGDRYKKHLIKTSQINIRIIWEKRRKNLIELPKLKGSHGKNKQQ